MAGAGMRARRLAVAGRLGRLGVFVAAILLCAAVTTAEAAVRADHPVYGFLERAWMRGWTERPASTLRPESRARILSLLEEVGRRRSEMAPHERRLLDQFLPEFRLYSTGGSSRWRRALGNTGLIKPKSVLFRGGVRPVQGRHDSFVYALSPIIGYSWIDDPTFSAASIFRTTGGVDLQAGYGDLLEAGIRFKDSAEYAANGRKLPPYAPAAAYTTPVSIGTGGVTYEETEADLTVHLSPFLFRLARERPAWGPSEFNRLFLSGAAPPFVYGELRLNVADRVRFSYLHASLDPSPLGGEILYFAASGKPRRVKNDKYFAAHRLEWAPSGRLSVGFEESVVYGERGPALGYLIPVNLFWTENHVQKRDDNVAWGIDFQAVPLPGVRTYGEFFLDEASFGDLFKDRLHNRTAVTLGVETVDLFGVPTLAAGLEYSRLRPFVYSHWFPINVYSHFGYPLGTPLKPNSEEWNAGIEWRPFAFWTFDAAGRYTVHGRSSGSVTAGGEITDPPGVAGAEYHFLGGDLTRRVEFRAGAEWEPLELLRLRFEGGAVRREGKMDPFALVEINWDM